MNTETRKIPMQILGLAPGYSSASAFTLILSEIGGNKKLPVVIGEHEAQAIALELENIKPVRPLTHDLLKNLAETFQVKVTEVFIESFAEGIFYSRIFFTNGTLEADIDARTSDAIVLALKFKAPIYAEKKVLDEAGIVFEDNAEGEDDDMGEEDDLSIFSVEELKDMLEDAEGKEEYEEASKIMEEIESRKKSKEKKK